MAEELDILIQKYLKGELSAEERGRVNELEGSPEWETLKQEYSELEDTLRKEAYFSGMEQTISNLRERRSARTNGKNKRWLWYGIAAAAIVTVIVVITQLDQNREMMAEDARTESTEAKDTGEGAAEEMDAGMMEAQEEGSDDAVDSEVVDFEDEAIINNHPALGFSPGNAAFDTLLGEVENSEMGILKAIVQLGSTDSVYVLNEMHDGVVYEKHLRYVGQTDGYAIFNLLSFHSEWEVAQRSILVTDVYLNYQGRYVVSTMDDLPDSALPNGLYYEIPDDEGNVDVQIVPLEDELDCIELPSGTTACPAYY